MTQYVVIALTLASVYALFAIGLSLAWGVGKTLNLAHGAIFMVAGFVVYRVTQTEVLSVWVLLLIGALCAGGLTLVAEFVAFRPIRRRARNLMEAELGQLVASLGLSTIIVSAAARATSSAQQPIPESVFRSSTYHLFGARIPSISIVMIIIATVLVAGTAVIVQRTNFGRALRAVTFDPRSSELLGISPERTTGLTMFLSGCLAGVAGALVAIQQLSFEAHSGDLFILKGFAIVILGGAGSVVGTALAALLLAAAETLTVVYIGSGYRDLVCFVLIIGVLLLRPGGLFGGGTAVRA